MGSLEGPGSYLACPGRLGIGSTASGLSLQEGTGQRHEDLV